MDASRCKRRLYLLPRARYRPAVSIWRQFWSAMHIAFHEPGPIRSRVEWGIYAFIAASVLLLLYEVGVEPDDPMLVVLAPIDRFILWFFGAELALRVGSYRPPEVDFYAAEGLARMRLHVVGRLTYLSRPMVLVDLVTVLALVPALRGLRAVRLLRVMRAARLFRYADPFERLEKAFAENRLLFGFGFSLVGIATILGGMTVYLVEGPVNPAMNDLGDGLWWGLVTLTTVGFGDIAPVTTMGRIVAGVLMVTGMVTLGLFAGIVGHTLPQAVLGIREEQIRMSGYIDHLLICGYDASARMFLDALSAERREEATPVVLFAPGERPPDVPPEFMWISGDPTKESELEKVRLAYASSVVLIANRAVTPQQSDANTILTAFTIRSYLQKHENVGRARPLHIVAEVLDAENVAHLQTAGVDEVVETTRVGFSLLAHATEMPGTAALVSELASVGAHSLYVGRRPADVDEKSFAEVARRLKHDYGVLLIGVRDRVTGRDAINPPDDLVVDRKTLLVYLAESPDLPPA